MESNGTMARQNGRNKRKTQKSSSCLLFTTSTLTSTIMPKTVPERIKDKNKTSINVTWLRYHPSSAPSMLNNSES